MRARYVWMVGVMAALGCGQPDDTERMVRHTLDQSGLRTVDVAVLRDAREGRLSGTVETLADRSRAAELAAAVSGAGLHVRNEIAVDGLGPLGSAGR